MSKKSKKKPYKKKKAVDGSVPKPKIRLSQCMIVKNEEKNIENALSWGKSIVCEQIVVDTGSTDRTVEIAEKMGAKVLRFEWIDDFSAAKNYALQQVKGNWVAFLDADEFFLEEGAAKLMEVLEVIHDNERFNVVRSKMLHIDEHGNILATGTQDRIFRNTGNLRYRYRIHEEPYYENEKMILCDAQEELLIYHTGYGVYSERPKKGARNIRLLERDLEDNPKDGSRMMYLADAYSMAGDDEKALEYYRKVVWDETVETNGIWPLLRSGLQIMRIRMNEPIKEIRKEYFDIREKLQKHCGDDHPDIDFYIGCLHFRNGDLNEAADCFERTLKKAKTYTGLETVTGTTDLELLYRVMAAAALNNKNPQKAVEYSVIALRADKYSPDGIKTLLWAFLTEWKEGMSIEPYWQFLGKIYDYNELKDLLFLYKFTNETDFTQLMERIYREIPEDVRVHLQTENK